MRTIVVGGGISGLCTAWSLVKRGHRVTLIEQGPIPNPLSASGDQHRLIRRGYRNMDHYARMIPEAFEAWEELWDDLGESHYIDCGILALSRAEGDEGDQVRDSLRKTGDRYETLNPAVLGERFPFLAANEFRAGYFTRDGGVLLCQKIAAALVRWLSTHGVELRTQTKVAAVSCHDGRVTLASGEVLSGDRVLVAAGAWTPGLMPDLDLPLKTYRTIALYVHPPASLEDAWKRAPGIQTIGGGTPGYALPPVGGTQLKFASGSFRTPTTNPDGDRVAAEWEGEAIRAHFAALFVKMDEYSIDHVVTCTYTFTSDDCFYLHWTDKVAVLSACSGHGFKFGAAIGRRAASGIESGEGDALQSWLRGEAVRMTT